MASTKVLLEDFSVEISIEKRFRQSELYREQTNKATGKQFNLVKKYSYCKTLLVDGIIQGAAHQKSKLFPE